MIGTGSPTCVLCKVGMETAEHSFFLCKESWKLWGTSCSDWNLSWCAPSDSKAFFLAWNAMDIREGDKLCRMSFFAMLWTIWLLRNEVVFKEKQWDASQAYDLVKLRADTQVLLVESESTNAVQWVMSPESAPRQHRVWVLRIENLKREEIALILQKACGAGFCHVFLRLVVVYPKCSVRLLYHYAGAGSLPSYILFP
ncbi:hypothetical protein QQP08_001819 [Theobroma cacao]|nr:hypothetical protein QQP08_001819 [Theobroma cacao]